MGSIPSKRKVSHFAMKDALPLRFINNDFHVSSPNGTIRVADRTQSAVEYSTHQKVQIRQPQEESLSSNPPGKRLKLDKKNLVRIRDKKGVKAYDHDPCNARLFITKPVLRYMFFSHLSTHFFYEMLTRPRITGLNVRLQLKYCFNSVLSQRFFFALSLFIAESTKNKL